MRRLRVKKTYIVGSRKSDLAMTQTRQTVALLKEKFPEIEFEIKGIVTKGDRLAHAHLSTIGGKGVFMKAIEQAIVDGEVDFAVHSMKDVPSYLPDEVVIGAIPTRNSPWDVILTKEPIASWLDLPKGSIIGTSSVRRGAQLLALRPDLTLKNIRGNIDTRYRKLMEEEYDAIVLAAAGINRLGWGPEIIRHPLSKEDCLPAIGQGALAIECRKDREDVLNLLQAIDCAESRACVTTERQFLSEMDGSCTFPIGGYAEYRGEKIEFTGFLGNLAGTVSIKECLTGEDPVELGKEVAKRFYQQGAAALMKELKSKNE